MSEKWVEPPRVQEAFEYLQGRSSVTVSFERGPYSRPTYLVIKGAGRVWVLSWSNCRPAATKWRVGERGVVKAWQGRDGLAHCRYFATAKEAADYLIGELRGEGL